MATIGIAIHAQYTRPTAGTGTIPETTYFSLLNGTTLCLYFNPVLKAFGGLGEV